MEETPENTLVPAAMWEHSEKMVICGPGSRPSPDTEWICQHLILDFEPQELEDVRNTRLLIISHPVGGILLELPEQTKTGRNV